MKNRETPTAIYAQPNADSDDPTTRGHISGGWKASEQSLIVWDAGGNGTVHQVLRGPNGERVAVDAAQHERLQRIMGEFARLYPETMQPSPDTEKSEPSESIASAEEQIRNDGVISQVPGVEPRTREVQPKVVPAVTAEHDNSAPVEGAANDRQESANATIIGSFSKSLDVAGVRDRVNAGTFDLAVLARGMYQAIERIQQHGVPKGQERQFAGLAIIKRNLFDILRKSHDTRGGGSKIGEMLRTQLNNIESLDN